MNQFIDILVNILEHRDFYTRGHTERGVFYARSIGRKLGLAEKELEHLRIGGMIHDIGKIGIPDVILLKPYRLTPEEFEIMKLHVKIGYEMLKGLDVPKGAFDILLYHQEKYDGTGYPHGAKGEDIPLLARIYTIADAFEAMTARRIYKRAKSWEEAFEELERLAGVHFDPKLVPYAIEALSGLEMVPTVIPQIDQEIEKIRWSFQYIDGTGAIKGDIFLPSLRAFIEQRESFCLTIFDIKNLSKINFEKGWEEGNEVLRRLVWAINLECCSMHDIRDVILMLMKEDVIDIESPVIFRVGGDEFAVIAPYIPPPDKPLRVKDTMKSMGVDVDFLQMQFPESFKTYEEALKLIFSFTRGKLIKELLI
ncbi:MAG: HD domain-containing protein [Acidobacteria bacterium]|jgi:GGDEF domain-containing protein|nr:MAG: HD domain-containing protein [Acidobacteriota bacterium]